MEGRSSRVSSSSIWGFVDDDEVLEGNSEGSTSLPGIGEIRRGLPVAPSINSLKVDLRGESGWHSAHARFDPFVGVTKTLT
jgi:hypothetical protein